MLDKRGAFDGSMQHHLRTDLFKGGVYDPREAIETFCHGEEGHLESMEGRVSPFVMTSARPCSSHASSMNLPWKSRERSASSSACNCLSTLAKPFATSVVAPVGVG
jgi:hypothetical protein